MTVRQQALTAVFPITESARQSLAQTLPELEDAICDALATVPSMHYGRFAVLTEGAPRLAFESNHDGERDAHLAQLAKALAPFEERLLGEAEGYEPGGFAELCAMHCRPASTFYLGHPGLSVQQIQADEAVRKRLAEELDRAHADARLESLACHEVRSLILERVKGDGLVLGPVDRGLPAQPQSLLLFWGGVVPAVVALALAFVPTAFLFVETPERDAEAKGRRLIQENDPRLVRISLHEDESLSAQNGLTHHVKLRPGAFRKTTLKLVLWFLEQARQKIAYEGQLGGISSIHFARWVMLEDDTVLFFSNYDGSWESYLGDFVDKAHLYLTAVWGNTQWFPDSHALVFGGAQKESEFKQWTRTFQVENQVWYSAYPLLTVSNVLNNVSIREGAVGDMSDEEARAWLARL